MWLRLWVGLVLCTSSAVASDINITLGSTRYPAQCETACLVKLLGLNVSGLNMLGSVTQNGYLNGDVELQFNGASYSASYSQGFVTSGTTLMPRLIKGKPVADTYVGSYAQYQDAVWLNDVYFFDRGVYTAFNGAVFDGQFYAATHMDQASGNGAYYGSGQFSASMVVDIRSRGKDAVRDFNRLNVVFVGTVAFKGKRQMGVFAQRDYVPGDPLTFAKATNNTLARFVEEQEQVRALVDHYLAGLQRNAERKQKRASIPWGKVFAITAGVAMAAQSGLPEDKKLEFLESYSKDVLNNSTDNMSALKSKYGNEHSANDILGAFNTSVSNLAQANSKNSGAQASGIAAGGNTNSATGSAADCESLRINLDTLAASTNPTLKDNYAQWQQAYEQNCRGHRSTVVAKPSYFSQIGRVELEQCAETDDIQTGMFCSNAMAHFYEYRNQLSQGGDQSTLDGLYQAHAESAKLYIRMLERLKPQP